MLLTNCRRGILEVGRKSNIACGYLVTGEVSQLDVSSRGEKQHKITVGCRKCATKRQTTYLCLKRVCGTDRHPNTLQAFTSTVWLLKIGGGGRCLLLLKWCAKITARNLKGLESISTMRPEHMAHNLKCQGFERTFFQVISKHHADIHMVDWMIDHTCSSVWIQSTGHKLLSLPVWQTLKIQIFNTV